MSGPTVTAGSGSVGAVPVISSPPVTIKKRKKTTWEWTLRCERCAHEWKAVGDEPPSRCASCKSPNFDRPARPYRRKASSSKS
jgi:rRNA maturation endonuclease Nob1